MAYRSLGSRQATAAADTTGDNPGNFTTVFDQSQLNFGVADYEVYRGVAQSVTPGATATVLVNKRPTSAAIFAAVSEWDPQQPPILQPGDQIFVEWSIASTGTPPVLTLWFRYDDELGGPT